LRGPIVDLAPYEEPSELAGGLIPADINPLHVGAVGALLQELEKDLEIRLFTLRHYLNVAIPCVPHVSVDTELGGGLTSVEPEAYPLNSTAYGCVEALSHDTDASVLQEPE